MKKILCVVALLGAALAGPVRADLKVFACEPEWGALTTALGGKHVDVYNATTALQDPHQVQARPSLLGRFRSSALAVCTGAELEIGWFPVLLNSAGNPRIKPGQPGLFEASSYVEMKEIPTSVDRANGDVHPGGNPHIQTDPRNIGKVAEALTQRLAEMDPDNATDYRSLGSKFQSDWTAALARWSEQIKPLQGVQVISYHKSWVYLCDYLGLKEIGALEPKPGIPPSAGHLEELISGFQHNPARMVIYAAYQSPQAAEFFAGKVGIPAVKLPFTVGGVDGTDELQAMYQVTIDRLLAGLNGKGSS